MVPHNRLTYGDNEVKAVKRIIKSGYWAGGEEVKRLEREVRTVTKRKYAIGVSSGLSALRLALLALEVKKGDEVIIPAYSCVAIPNAVLACGATPVPVDVIHNNWNLDFKNIKSKISSKTKAIIAINTFGLAADIKKINTLHIPVIEDCAHALGTIENKYTFGKQGTISISSFYATKLIGGGEGGIVMTDNKNIAEYIYDYRNYTDKKPSGLRLNEKMSNIDASVSLCQLERLSPMVAMRRETAEYYQTAFSKLREKFPDFTIPVFEPRIWYRYVVYCKSIPSDELINELRANGISSAMPVENWMGKLQHRKYPEMSFACKHIVSLPIYPALSKKDRAAVVTAIEKTLQKLYI